MPMNDKEICRSCSSEELFLALDLGSQPVANHLLSSKNENVKRFPLHLRVCENCALGQIGDFLTSKDIFKDYRYLSSISETFLTHARNFVESIIRSNFLEHDDYVLEIASNDGYLLKHFVENEIKCIGVEPATNVSKISESYGIETINDFFTKELATKLVSTYGKPRLIIANNVLAHVPDLNDFVAGLAMLAGDRTIISIENPPLSNILLRSQFDSIYHEHYSYLSVNAVSALMRRHGLELFKVENIPTHGGSLRFWVSREQKNGAVNLNSISKACSHEIAQGLTSINAWEKCKHEIELTLESHQAFLSRQTAKGITVLGAGAAAKTTMFLNLLSDTTGISAILDSSPEKQGRYIPGVNIPIEPFSGEISTSNTMFMIYGWNLADEFARIIRSLYGNNAVIFKSLPKLSEVTNATN